MTSNLLRVQIYPTMGEVPPFSLHLRGTDRVLRGIDPTWSAVRLGGSLVSDLMVIDEAAEVYAPIPPRWAHWKATPGKRKRASLVAATEQPDQVVQGGPHA
ncbi:hypothetical protein GCM10008957_50880 [Deinococcus ruber]|uniref:Uncharacterized protein n=1 Tax=Deinococcus ruber TaxID=1848197 RepID=A0A918FFB9_9DEIO|nr:hypothetical protein GCM10008957_50880 [Deinococcus ruber]